MTARRHAARSLPAALALPLLAPLAALLAYLPARLSLWAGRRLGGLLWWVLPHRRRLAASNVARAFGPEIGREERDRIARQSFEHLGMNLVAPFFGVPASTSRGLALIALRTGAPVVPVFIRRVGRGHRVEFDPAVPVPPSGDLLDYTVAFNRVIESAIRRTPEQWFWMHDRWRTRMPVPTP